MNPQHIIPNNEPPPAPRSLFGATAATLALLIVAACGGAGGGSGSGVARPDNLPDLPLQSAATVSNAPILYIKQSLHIGADVAPPANALTQSAVHGDVKVSHGRVKDGIGADELIAYLSDDEQISEYKNSLGIARFGATPPPPPDHPGRGRDQQPIPRRDGPRRSAHQRRSTPGLAVEVQRRPRTRRPRPGGPRRDPR